MVEKQLAGILELDVDGRILLVEEIWDSIAADSVAVPVTDAQRSELDRRLTGDEAGARTVAWSEVRLRLLIDR